MMNLQYQLISHRKSIHRAFLEQLPSAIRKHRQKSASGKALGTPSSATRLFTHRAKPNQLGGLHTKEVSFTGRISFQNQKCVDVAPLLRTDSGYPKLWAQLSHHLPPIIAFTSKALECICTYKFSSDKSPKTQQLSSKAFFVLLF